MTIKLVYLAVLTAIAVIIYVVESWIPIPIPIPGVKLGLANVITLFALFYTPAEKQPIKQTAKKNQLTPTLGADAFTILLFRVLIGLTLTGRATAFLFSMAGGIFALVAVFIAKRFVTQKQIWVCGVIGAIFHNIGQILIAMLVTGTPWIITYLPIFIIAGIITGAITGMAAQLTILRIMEKKSVEI
ncbi:MAG: Gx transporter family protein [Oscillospiraceae bacterium]|nr:Gx transporter family protein [Oscillospiraceae bacterium]MCL2279652.1 Gx transporter family protein [Oscillospiraceae bacterium]